MVVILEGNGLITRGEEGRKVRGPCMQPCHAMPWSHHAFRRCLCTLHYLTSSSSSGNVRRENWNGLRDCGGGSVDAERRGANFGTKLGRQTTVCSLARPSVRVRVRSTWKCGSSCFQTRMGIGEGRATERGRKEGRNTDFTARWNMKVTTTTNLIAAMSLKSETRIRHRDRRPFEPQAGEQHQNGI